RIDEGVALGHMEVLVKTLRLLLTLVFLGGAQEAILTNDSVVKMVKGGISEEVVLSVVKSSPAKYDLTPDQLITLKSAGVPDRVVAAMVERASGGGAPGVGKATGATPAAGTVAGGDPNDPMSSHDSGIYLYAKDRNGEYK